MNSFQLFLHFKLKMFSHLDPAASHSMTYSLPAESGSPTLVMLTSTGGKIISSSRLLLSGCGMLDRKQNYYLLSGAEMLLLLDLQVSLTPGTEADTESQVEQLYQNGQEAKTGHKKPVRVQSKTGHFPLCKNKQLSPA